MLYHWLAAMISCSPCPARLAYDTASYQHKAVCYISWPVGQHSAMTLQMHLGGFPAMAGTELTPIPTCPNAFACTFYFVFSAYPRGGWFSGQGTLPSADQTLRRSNGQKDIPLDASLSAVQHPSLGHHGIQSCFWRSKSPRRTTVKQPRRLRAKTMIE